MPRTHGQRPLPADLSGLWFIVFSATAPQAACQLIRNVKEQLQVRPTFCSQTNHCRHRQLSIAKIWKSAHISSHKRTIFGQQLSFHHNIQDMVLIRTNEAKLGQPADDDKMTASDRHAISTMVLGPGTFTYIHRSLCCRWLPKVRCSKGYHQQTQPCLVLARITAPYDTSMCNALLLSSATVWLLESMMQGMHKLSCAEDQFKGPGCPFVSHIHKHHEHITCVQWQESTHCCNVYAEPHIGLEFQGTGSDAVVSLAKEAGALMISQHAACAQAFRFAGTG